MCSFQRDLFAEIGGYPIDQIDEQLLLHALRKVESRGAIEPLAACASGRSACSALRLRLG
jgi:hypothetical protein